MKLQEQERHEMPKAYEPGVVEEKWYKFWLEKNYFRAEVDKDKDPFVVIMPLPNVTGGLHIGHVMFITPEDIMTRWHRMKGDSALWLPGIDHAGIAAQVVVERMLAKEGIDRHELGREKFVERMYQWAQECRYTITEQHRRLGASCDWSREKFTLEEGPSLAVRTAFVRLYNKGLIYRGERIINWCPRCATALSDLEVEHKDLGGNLYYVRYHMADNDGYITVATTRPETILGDAAVAVNPNDNRFEGMVGKKVILPGVNRVIPIIADEAVATDFGTGAVKITPAHDPVDFEVGQRHGLEIIHIMNADVTMNENAGPYQGMDRFDCREAILADLGKDGLLVKVEPYNHSVGHCMRCQTIIEPVASRQWFINTKPLAKPAIEAVLDGRTKIIPERFNRVYLNWMENIRDWCISRQLWWGHRIPVWYCQDCGELTVAVDEPQNCRYCNSGNIKQDPDVLDTWFSSALWPHSTLGWPNDTEELRYFYPTAVMETGYDILFFWVARMIMMGLEDTGEVPFHTVYLHGLLRDENGDKMSKVRGNVLNPLDILKDYGADAIRFALSTGTSPGNDVKLTPSRLEAGRNFANKLWNATRFVIRNIDSEQTDINIQYDVLPLEDRWILSRLNYTIASATALMEDFQFGEALKQIHDFLWGEYCDWYIEIAKIRLHSESEEIVSPVPVLVNVLETALRLLHPYMPFLTEELWQNLKSNLPNDWQKTESIMVAAYPVSDKAATDKHSEQIIESVIEVIRSIRNVRAQYSVENNKWIGAEIYSGEFKSEISAYSGVIQTLSRAKPVKILGDRQGNKVGKDTLVIILDKVDVVIPMGNLFDREAEEKKMQEEIEDNLADIARLEARLNNVDFTTKAPPAIVAKEKDRLALRKNKLAKLKEKLLSFKEV
ncbi:MAG: valine--tRNA ligase [Dehalococcoidales bacterium]|nr:valine--tRNA ligase [Dehalococcoidales bacterium]